MGMQTLSNTFSKPLGLTVQTPISITPTSEVIVARNLEELKHSEFKLNPTL